MQKNEAELLPSTKMKLNLTPFIKINQKRIISLNVRAKTMDKLLVEKLDEYLCDLEWGDVFLNKMPKVQTIREKVDHCTSSKLKPLSFEELHQGNEKTSHRMGESICKLYII